MARSVDDFMNKVIAGNPGEPEFHQAVHEVAISVMPVVEATPAYRQNRILERLIEPERVMSFRVTWQDDRGEVHINRGFRVEMNSALGPYKGGLRFHPSVNLSILKFLGFEQVFKNSLTTLPLGGGKGGADFEPKGRSDYEVMRFCQAFMDELFRHIGANTDVPAGDIGVGTREIGFLFGQYKKLKNEFTGVLTGKGLSWGGSLIRREATGYGAVFFCEEMLARKGDSVRGKTAVVSGSGNVAQYTVEKLNQLGAKVITLSDSSGTIVDRDGIGPEKLKWVMELKNVRRGRIREYADHFKGATYLDGQEPWGVPGALAFPCATQNEIDAKEARMLVANGLTLVAEGANMPTTPEAVEILHAARVLFAPGKAANAGGVSTSSLEMSQNAMHLNWTRDEVEGRLKEIMHAIHTTCVRYGQEGDWVDYVKGANVGAFVKVADAMLDQGLV